MGEAQATDERAAAETATAQVDGGGGRSGFVLPAVLGAVVALLAALCGVLLWHHHTVDAAQSERESFLQAARDGATNMTTISHEHPEQDVRRVLDGATGQFHDDFEQSAESYVSVVKQAQVSAVAERVDAGIESQGDDSATVLVQVTSKVTNRSGPEPQPRVSRLRVTVDRVDGGYKVSKMEFVA
ncbi:mammalian cell entry protein [Rhodococcus sp. NPDC059234]|uniref:mammalian cell entry protein n=1 Tax=Rhodococcus sp. NPDC059234 TaxID=3346781 RepID=UPI0036703389